MKNAAIEAAFGHRTVTHAGVSAFGAITGDYARLHLDHHYGKTTPSGGSIAHGLLSACWAVGALTRHAPQIMGVGQPGAAFAGFHLRLGRMVHVGDTLCVRSEPGPNRETNFEVLNQDAQVATSGSVRVLDTGAQLPPAPDAWNVEPQAPAPEGRILYAEDLLTHGPCGQSIGRTLTETDVVHFATETGETNPLYLNREFAERSRFAARIAPPMLVFCLGFSDFLNALLPLPLPSTGFAGHLGDSWCLYRGGEIGETIRARYKTLQCRTSKSRPEMAIVDFGLQIIDALDKVALEGKIHMMIPAHATEDASGGTN